MSDVRRRLVFTSLFFVCTAGAVAADSAPTYRLKGDAPTGSLLKKTAASGRLPYDKRYDQFTAVEKDRVKAAYEPMGTDDEPPFPVDGLGPLMKSVSKVANALHAEGTISLAVDVGPDGAARSVSVFVASDKKTTEAIASLLMVQQYKPAVCAGQPCAMAFPLNVQFDRKL